MAVRAEGRAGSIGSAGSEALSRRSLGSRELPDRPALRLRLRLRRSRSACYRPASRFAIVAPRFRLRLRLLCSSHGADALSEQQRLLARLAFFSHLVARPRSSLPLLGSSRSIDPSGSRLSVSYRTVFLSMFCPMHSRSLAFDPAPVPIYPSSHTAVDVFRCPSVCSFVLYVCPSDSSRSRSLSPRRGCIVTYLLSCTPASFASHSHSYTHSHPHHHHHPIQFPICCVCIDFFVSLGSFFYALHI